MKQYNLLIVDDEKRFADMLAKRLSLRGCHCAVCYSGQQALDLVRRKNFYLILLDLRLPDIYGIEGPCWMLSDFDYWWDDDELRRRLLYIAKTVERESSLL